MPKCDFNKVAKQIASSSYYNNAFNSFRENVSILHLLKTFGFLVFSGIIKWEKS